MMPAGMLTDGEIMRELETATGERRAELEAETAERREYRKHIVAHDPSMRPAYCHVR